MTTTLTVIALAGFFAHVLIWVGAPGNGPDTAPRDVSLEAHAGAHAGE